MSTHSNLIGGSSAARALACPGSIPLAAKAPPAPASEYAAEGTVMHLIMERLLKDPDLEPESFFGKRFEVDTEVDGEESLEVVVSQEHLDELVTPALDAFDELCDEIEKTAGSDELTFDVEQRVEFKPPLAGCFGTADILGTCGKYGFVIDWKFGRGVKVEAVNNTQLRFYMAAALEDDAAASLFEGIDTFMLGVIQPAYREGGEKWALETVTRAELEAIRADLVEAMNAALEQPPVLNVGPHCRWCPAQPRCPAIYDTAADAVEREVEPADPTAIGENLTLAAELESWIKAVRGHAHHVMEQGTAVPGFKLVAGRSSRKWVDEAAVEQWYRDHRVPFKKFTVRKLLSVAQAEKAKIRMPPAEMVTKVTSKTAIAPEDDKRPAILSVSAGMARVAKMGGG